MALTSIQWKNLKEYDLIACQKFLRENGISVYCLFSVKKWVVYHDDRYQPKLGLIPIAYYHADRYQPKLGLIPIAYLSKRPTYFELHEAINTHTLRGPPNETHKDYPEGRYHSITGPAISYSDGFKIYCVHGMLVDPDWFEKPGALTPTIAFKEPNIEQRKAAFDILGWDRVLNELNAQIIDEDPDPYIGTLLQVQHPAIGSGKERFLKVLCGTGRTFIIPVAPTMETALQANAASYGIPAELFKPEGRS
jgi:hypothetical protein